MADLVVLHHGAKSDACRRLRAATDRRLRARDLDGYVVREGDVLDEKTLLAVRKAAWALGAAESTLDRVTGSRLVPVGVQRLILNPGTRNARQRAAGKGRMAALRRQRRARAEALAHERSKQSKRARIVDLAQEAAAHYRQHPGAYHYLAGGVANLVCMRPTPAGWRSDCSQFVASLYKAAGVDSPAAPLAHQWASTYSMASSRHMRETTNPRPGDLGMYGSRSAPHHVEVYCAEPGQEFIGHGSPPIDSLTPGRPDFYLTADFLN